MDEIDVSVILPSYNVGAFIEKALKSVINQTLRNIEILCIDAGSTDGTTEIIRNIAKEDERVQVIISPRKSYGYQVNCGIAHATGKYIAVVETDDYVASDMYQTLYNIAKKRDADIVKGNYKAFFTQTAGNTIFLKRENLLDGDMYGRPIVPLDNPSVSSSDWYLWTGIYKRSMINSNHIKCSETPGAAFQDIGFLHRTNVASKKSIYIDKPFYYYCIDREGSSSNAGRSIEFSYYEYNRLLEEEWKPKEQIALFERMATYFSGCINGIKEKDLYNDKTVNQFAWFANQLQDAIDGGIISKGNVSPVIWNHIYPLPKSIQQAFDKRKDITNSLMKQLGEPDKVSIVVFGCGNFGLYAYNWLELQHYKIIAYSDNNDELWGGFFKGVKIIPPEKIKELLFDSEKVLIANEKYFQDIRSQLISMGISANDLVVYSES